ncbi:NAD(P)/FAD-dependent oxidoreductase [Methanoplanus sp. FWC-SCC4]|uniref:NAD(P)/FAD-dependent oxidoreductase n=1 Tax=Methanochimaera problematica TaxID=2609417 RepID=A0AA97FBZ2_9EURY|nr:NAD(P)/FAD-dependent oxidoreductase [Methanoplanus sp. FWC-SCC4]WOF15248.1 NAD(P)/FAD-dependent oxidoreductase [Methanoplanus sp. FWC-SCC4]
MITVIGGGPSGRMGAIHLALAGEKVRLIEKRGALGGQCLHQGCMVICGLNDAARIVTDSKNLRNLSVFNTVPEVSLNSLWTRMNKIQSVISGILDKETIDAGVELINGEAFVDGSNITLNGEKLDTDKILITTGSRPIIPEIPGIHLKGIYNPHSIFSLKEVPEKLTIIGGGVIASEYAQIFSAFGAEVTMVIRSSLLRGKPDLMRTAAFKELGDVNIREYTLLKEICGETLVESVKISGNGKEEEIPSDAVLIASGLRPNSDCIKGIKKGESGEILVNENYETSVKGVYAAGDVTGAPFMTPVARMEGTSAAKSILGQTPEKLPSFIPQSVKLHYEHSFCRTNNDNSKAVSLPAPSGPGSFWSVPKRYTGKSLIEYEKDTGRLTGMYLGAPSSAPVAAYIAYMMEKGASIADFNRFIEVHPSTDGISVLLKYAGYLENGGK